MKTIIVIATLSLFLNCNRKSAYYSKEHNIQITRNLNVYKNNVNIFETTLFNNDELLIDVVENVIPINIEEFLYFYKLTYPNVGKQDLFDKINKKIFRYAKEDLGNIFYLSLNMSAFVDGEYADTYFSEIENVVFSNKKSFCNTYKIMSVTSKTRIYPLYNEICNGVMRTEEKW